ncbi:hypothetical protein C8J57DRAFT_1516652 [Mycena rebaudengoi]|nr:hypothetical protein C8J57DRAFT_1516652 [Mycena rebaudengoi]
MSAALSLDFVGQQKCRMPEQLQIGYYEGWAAQSGSRACDIYPPEMISAETLTHINFAFALISPTFQIIEMTPGDSALWSRTTALKKRNVALQVFLSIGGWSFNDPPTQNIFSDLVGSAANTNTFISSALQVMQTYGFNGIDIDWEYPAADDRGGVPADKANFVTFMAKVRAAFGKGYGLTFTAPSSFWYLQHFDLPGLLKSADWVNVMTYDLHGTWDGVDPFIGAIVLAHTNLTEIKSTMQLFSNVGVDPAQIVLGIGFYGRSFQLSSPECNTPGCPFVGGAAPGVCSLNSGTLMFSEIETIISADRLEPVYDTTAAVKYIVWNQNQWVSYDDAETLLQKVNYANSICLGGTMIWSVDQDDTSYTALRGLYSDIAINTPSSSETGNECQITGCGQSCPSGYNTLTSLSASRTETCSSGSNAKLCCPPGDEPQQCSWRGGGSSTCNAQCNVGEIVMALDEVGDDGHPAALGSEIHRHASMPFVLSAKSEFSVTFGEMLRNLALDQMFIGCIVATRQLMQDFYLSRSIGFSLRLQPVARFIKVVAAHSATFTVDFDDNTGTSDTSSTGSGSSGIGDDGQENDSPFGEVFISSPNPGSVSSMDAASDWVITGCLRSSDQPQEILAYCSKPVDHPESGCGHVFINQAEHTIVRMPKTCGLGPYARIASFEVHSNQDILSEFHANRKPVSEPVYAVKFDYNFAAIPSGNGPVLMRADVTDMPGYWHEYSRACLNQRKRDFHQPEAFERRWFGPFDDWLERLTTFDVEDSLERNFHWKDTYQVFHAETQCPNFSAMLDISITGQANINSKFGYYLEASVIPPSIQQAAGAGASATLTVEGAAEAHFSSDKTELASFGFPGLYYPGLLTLGPSLHLYGQLSGQLSLSGKFSATVGYQLPSIDMSFGKQDSNHDVTNISPGVGADSSNWGYDYSVGYNIDLEGNAQVHVIPSLQLGLSVLGGLVMDAQVFAELDLWAGVGIEGSVSSTAAPQFCLTPQFGADLNVGFTGSVLFWDTNPLSTNLFSADFSVDKSCFSSVDQGGGQSKRDFAYVYEVAAAEHRGLAQTMEHSSSRPAYLEHGTSSLKRRVYPLPDSLLEKRGVPFLSGDLSCPASGSQIIDTPGGSLDCSIYDDASDDLDADQIDDRVERRSLKNSFLTDNSTGRYYDLQNPGILSPAYTSYNPRPIDLGLTAKQTPRMTTRTGAIVYAREHVYEESLAALFVDYLQQSTALWQNDDGTQSWCNWVRQNLQSSPAYFPAPSVFSRLSACYPSNDNGTPMPVTEQVANVAKNLAMYNTERQINLLTRQKPLRDPGEFQLKCPTAQGVRVEFSSQMVCLTFAPICRLRGASGVIDYMNEVPIRQMFLTGNTCIRNVWDTWQQAYRAAANVDAPDRANVEVTHLYDNWIHDIVAGMAPWLKDEIQNLIRLVLPDPSTISLSFNVLLDNQALTNPAGAPVGSNAPYTQNFQVTRSALTSELWQRIGDINVSTPFGFSN